jgi:hypothetical protein
VAHLERSAEEAMDFLRYLETEWQVVSSAPFVFITFILIAATASFALARTWYSHLANIARERREFSEEQTTVLRRQIEELKSRSSSDADISELRARIEKMPRIHFGDTPPHDSKDGDLWFQGK